MARTPFKSPKSEARFPVLPALVSSSHPEEAAPSSFDFTAQLEPALFSAPSRGMLAPIPVSALEGLGVVVVGLVQIAIDGKSSVVPVGLAPFAGSDTVDVPGAGYFVDELGRCGILLNGNDGSWQKALPRAVEEARKALAASSAFSAT